MLIHENDAIIQPDFNHGKRITFGLKPRVSAYPKVQAWNCNYEDALKTDCSTFLRSTCVLTFWHFQKPVNFGYLPKFAIVRRAILTICRYGTLSRRTPQTGVGWLKLTNLQVFLCCIFVRFRSKADMIIVHYDNTRLWISADTNRPKLSMTLNDPECQSQLKVQFLDSCLMQRYFSRVRCSMAWMLFRISQPVQKDAQLTLCFSETAKLLQYTEYLGNSLRPFELIGNWLLTEQIYSFT